MSSDPVPDLIDKIKDSIVVIRNGKIVSSGCFIDNEGRVLTVRHGIGNANEVVVETIDGRQYMGRVVKRDDDGDMVVLHTAKNGVVPVELSNVEDIRLGQKLWCMGNPLGYLFAATRGCVSHLSRQITYPTGEILTNLLQTDVAINSGNSGGPIFDETGKMVGMVAAVRSEAENIGFAIRIDTIRNFLNRYSMELQQPIG